MLMHNFFQNGIVFFQSDPTSQVIFSNFDERLSRLEMEN